MTNGGCADRNPTVCRPVDKILSLPSVERGKQIFRSDSSRRIFARNLDPIARSGVAIPASSFSLEDGIAFIAVDAGINFHRRADINRVRVIPP